MSQALPKPKLGKNFSAAHLGTLADLGQYKFGHAGLPFEIEGKVFLNTLLGLTGAEISFNKLPPKGGMPFYHQHKRNEEIYLFVKGKGEFQVDGQTIAVGEGSVIRVAPNGERCWRNTSGEPLYYIVVQVPANGYQGEATIGDGIAVQKEVRWD